jgi:hypothetical protein
MNLEIERTYAVEPEWVRRVERDRPVPERGRVGRVDLVELGVDGVRLGRGARIRKGGERRGVVRAVLVEDKVDGVADGCAGDPARTVSLWSVFEEPYSREK